MDDILLKREPRETHPTGQYPAVCVDLIDLGMRFNDFQGRESASHACVFIFATGEKTTKGHDFTIPYECNITFGEKSKLLKFLTQWRGRPFLPAELAAGFKLASLVGKVSLISLMPKTSKTGNEYVVIDAIMPLPKGMPPPVVGAYQRPEFWAQKKAEYGAAYDKFLGRTLRNDPRGSGESMPEDPMETPF